MITTRCEIRQEKKIIKEPRGGKKEKKKRGDRGHAKFLPRLGLESASDRAEETTETSACARPSSLLRNRQLSRARRTR